MPWDAGIAQKKSLKSDRTLPKATPFLVSQAKTPKSDRTPQLIHGIELYKEFRRTLIYIYGGNSTEMALNWELKLFLINLFQELPELLAASFSLVPRTEP